MTETEIHNATDAELDRLAAEHVMGRPWRKPTHGNCCTCQTCGHGHNNCQCGYSDDCEQCFELIDKMRADGWCRSVCADANGALVTYSRADAKGIDDEFSCEHESELRATTEAAVLAKMGENNDT